MTIEQLRREVAREVSAAIAVGEAKGAPAISYALESRRVRAAFDAYDKAVIAANKPITHRWNIELDGDDLLICDGSHDKGEECKFVRYARVAARPTFEGGEEEVQQRISDVFAGRGDGTYDEAIEVLSLTSALLDAKDAALEKERKAGIQTYKNWMTVSTERDAALSRAEQAEAALAEERKAMSEAASYAIEDLREWLVNYPDAYDRDTTEQAITTLSRFILPAKPAVDPLVDCLEQALMTDTKDGTARLASNLRAAIERAGGVKAVFGEGV